MITEALKVFVLAVEHKNFSRAAEELHLSQPGVSLQIRNLENEFGTKLIHRSPKHVELTQAGEILYHHAKKILGLYDLAKEQINQLRNVVTGSLKIGASFTIGEYILPRLLAQFAKKYAFVDIQVTIANTEEITQAVRSHQLDIALVEGSVAYTDVEIVPFMEDEMILIFSKNHPLSHLDRVTIDDLQHQIWVFRESGSGTRAFSDKFVRDCELLINKSYEFSSSQGVKEAVEAGLGIAIVSKWIVRKELQAGEVKTVDMNDLRLSRQLSILRPLNIVNTMAAEVFVEKLKLFVEQGHI